MLYRIYTEDLNRVTIKNIIMRRFEGFVMFKAQGIYRGSAENALVIEIDTFKDDNYIGVVAICKEIKALNAQTSVLLQRIGSDSKLI